MRKFIPAATLVATFLATSAAFGAQCPKHEQDGKRVTVSGKISSATSYSPGRISIEVKGCDDLVIVMKKAPGCTVGKTVTAKGRFEDCDYFEWGYVCWNGVLENATGSCK